MKPGPRTTLVLQSNVGRIPKLTASSDLAGAFPSVRLVGRGRADLLQALDARPTGDIYRIAVRFIGADPRIELRESQLDDDALSTLRKRLARLDAKGPWTTDTLRLVADNPEVRAADLAGSVGRDTPSFKTDVRKLKNLGLTESLLVGYRISPRGQQYLDSLLED